jgi:hypothetical protein
MDVVVVALLLLPITMLQQGKHITFTFWGKMVQAVVEMVL